MRRTYPHILLTAAALMGTLSAAERLERWDGEAPIDRMGSWRVGTAGDVDGDAVPDVVAGAKLHDGPAGLDAGRAYVYSGATGTLLWRWDGEAAGDEFAHAVAAAGDVDGDGRGDVVVGAWLHDVAGMRDAGRAYVYSGGTGALLWSAGGETVIARMGFDVDGGADFDGDGRDDVVLAAKTHFGPGGENSGRVTVHAGATGALLRTWDGEQPRGEFGFSVDVVELDLDAVPDVVVGARFFDDLAGADSGRAYAYSGADGALVHLWPGEQADGQLGIRVAAAGDVDGDGRDDVLVGARTHDGPGGVDAGRAYLYAGGDGTLVAAFDGAAAGDELGRALSGGDDFDGDGVADLLLGAPGPFEGPDRPGAVYRYSGATRTLLEVVPGAAAGDALGAALGGAGDVDLDGTADWLAGAPFHDGDAGPNSGQVTLYSGALAAAVALEAACRVACPSPGIVWRATGIAPGDGGGDLVLELTAPVVRELDSVALPPGPFDVAREAALPPGQPDPLRCPLELTLRATLTGGAGGDVSASVDVEAIRTLP